MTDKSTVSSLITDFITFVQTQFRVTLKALRTDNGTEFVNAALSTKLSSLGIVHQNSFVYTPQHNGLVERKHMHLLNCARALMFHASLPIGFWGECLLTAVYLINRTPTPIVNHKSPYEVLYNCVPDYSNIIILGCLCYATIVPHLFDKFASRSVKGVFLGYPYAKAGYKVLNLATKQVFISRDVHFVESVFPFRDISVPDPQLLFPPAVDYVDYDHLHSVSQKSTVLDNEHVLLHALAKFSDYVGLPKTVQGYDTIHSTHAATTGSSAMSNHEITEPQYYKQAIQSAE